MGVQERRAREKQELRGDILAAARDLFIHEGFENVSMRKIAEKIEYSPTTIYLYFQDKADLLDSICEETLERLHERLDAIREANPDPLDRMYRGLRAYIEFGLEHPNDYRVAFMMEFKGFAESGRNVRCHAMGEKAFDGLRRDVIDCIRTGVFAPRDAEAVSQAIWAAIHGLTSLLIVRCHFPWVEQKLLMSTLVDTLVEGFKAPEIVSVS
jgi:AcrR family transcriptional regulator